MEEQMAVKSPQTPFARVRNFISWVMFIAVICCCVLVAHRWYIMKTTGEQAFLFGYRPLIVLTGSMEPYMETSGICLTKQITSPDDVQVGDIVCYHVQTNDGKTLRITHRVIRIEDGLYYTKGDNNRVDDGYGLTFDNLEAEVVGVWNGAKPVVRHVMWLGNLLESDPVMGTVISVSEAAIFICLYLLVCNLFGIAKSFIFRKETSDAPKAVVQEATPIPDQDDSPAISYDISSMSVSHDK